MNGLGRSGFFHRSQKRPWLRYAESDTRPKQSWTYDDNEEVDNLARIALDVQDERVRDVRRRGDNEDNLARVRSE